MCVFVLAFSWYKLPHNDSFRISFLYCGPGPWYLLRCTTQKKIAVRYGVALVGCSGLLYLTKDFPPNSMPTFATCSGCWLLSFAIFRAIALPAEERKVLSLVKFLASIGWIAFHAKSVATTSSASSPKKRCLFCFVCCCEMRALAFFSISGFVVVSSSWAAARTCADEIGSLLNIQCCFNC